MAEAKMAFSLVLKTPAMNCAASPLDCTGPCGEKGWGESGEADQKRVLEERL
jgi:hypothetical protein